MNNLFFEESDEEIAFQLQLEALAQGFPTQEYQAPSSQQASTSRNQATSSNTNGGARYPGPQSVADQAEEDMLLALRLQAADNIHDDFLIYVEDDSLVQDAGSSACWGGIVEMECEICMEAQPHTAFVTVKNCNHEYCLDCCSKHAEAKIEGGDSQVNCPHLNCSYNFELEQCKFLLSSQSFQILTTRQTEAAIPVSQKFYCPFKDCSALMEKPKGSKMFRSRAEETFVECGTCHRAFCLQCNVPWHANQNCSEFRGHRKNVKASGDEKLRKLAKKEKWQICKECQQVIELEQGCYHMTCVCGNEFCYTCGAKWKNKHATCKCKLWDETNIIMRS